MHATKLLAFVFINGPSINTAADHLWQKPLKENGLQIFIAQVPHSLLSDLSFITKYYGLSLFFKMVNNANEVNSYYFLISLFDKMPISQK